MNSRKTRAANAETVQVTQFADQLASVCEELPMTVTALENLIRTTKAAAKDELPWIKFGTFGDQMSDRGCLRHDANVLSITGIECDYDTGTMPMSAAAEAVRAAGVEALFYTSASNAPDNHRWRCLAFLSTPIAGTLEEMKAARAHWVGILNAITGAGFARESFNLSTSFYYGHVAGRPPIEVVRTDGVRIDRMPDPPAPVMKTSAPAGGVGAKGDGRNREPDDTRSADLFRKVLDAVRAGTPQKDIHGQFADHPHVLKLKGAATKTRAIQRCIEKAQACPGSYERNDTGNARRLIAEHGEDLRFCVQTKEWVVWNGVRWVFDERALLTTARLKASNTLIWDEARGLTDPEQQKKHASWAVASQNSQKLAGALASAQSEQGMAIHVRDLDADPMLLGVRNGVVDLRTGQFREGERQDLITKSAGCAFDPDATCPNFERFLASVFEPEIAAYLIRVIGYILTGMTTEQLFWFFLGKGGAGKSVLIEIIKALMGEYGANVRTDVITSTKRVNKSGPSEEEARLAGVRFAAVNETTDGMQLNTSLIKDLTGGDTITARKLNANSIEFIPQFKLVIRGNFKPSFDGADGGLARRMKLVWFSKAVPEKQRDKSLGAKLRAELPGILNLAIKGCLQWQSGGLREPRAITDATRTYLDANDNIGLFLGERCRFDDRRATENVTNLYNTYVVWAESCGMHPVGQRRFSESLEARDIQKVRRGVGMVFIGVTIVPYQTPEAQAAEECSLRLQAAKKGQLRAVK